jgi:hypothetical protein
MWRDLGGQGQAAVFRIMGAVPREKPIFITKASHNVKFWVSFSSFILFNIHISLSIV